jgi:hypothetical protein
MYNATNRKHKSQSIIAKFWNEFLFAREFEYETPLTPDEVADTLKRLENQEHKSGFLSSSKLVYKVNYEGSGDKAGHFTIELESIYRGKWWANNTAMQQVEGSITVNPDTGLSTIQGRTLFNRQYYLLFLAMFLFNFFAQSADNGIVFMFVWILIIIAFWYSMYRERNKLADRLDDVIMNAKSERGMLNLMDDESAKDALSIEEELQQESYS